MTGSRIGNRVAALALMLLLIAGCGTVEHKVSLEQGYRVQAGTKVELGPVKNATGQSFDIDIEKMLADALVETLKDRDLYWTAAPAPKLILTADIVQYAKGDAFKRWLAPGWGATALVVRARLTDPEGHEVGQVDAKRTVEAGGLYTVGAWETVFGSLAGDVVTDLEEQVKRRP
jgi:hypothetical protein